MTALDRPATPPDAGHRRLCGLLVMPRRTMDRVLPEPLLSELEQAVDLVRREPLEDLADPAAPHLLGQADVVVTSWGTLRLDEQVLAMAPRLRAVVHVAGSVKKAVSPACWERGIVVSSAAAANAVPVAEYTASMVVLANKRVLPLARVLQETRGPVSPEELFPGLGNYGQRVGLIGASRIGREVIRLLQPYQLRLAVADPYLDQGAAAELGVELMELDELLAWADVVSLHAPSLPETHGMLDRRRIALLRPGTTFINTARGEIVDQEALTERLVRGDLHAVLDVTSPFVLPAEHPLYGLPNVLLTPHIAGSLGSELERMTRSAIEEVRRLQHGLPLLHPVPAERLPITA